MAPALKIASLLWAALFAAAASAKTIKVVATSDQTFDPDLIEADKGDVLEFRFQAGNHSVAMGNFDLACTPAPNGGFFSGFWMVEGGESPDVFLVTLTSTEPMVFYSTQGRECAGGMSGVVNEGRGSETLTAYREAAGELSSAVSPREPFGGARESAGGRPDVGDHEQGRVEDGNPDRDSDSGDRDAGSDRDGGSGDGDSGSKWDSSEPPPLPKPNSRAWRNNGDDDGGSSGCALGVSLGMLAGVATVAVFAL